MKPQNLRTGNGRSSRGPSRLTARDDYHDDIFVLDAVHSLNMDVHHGRQLDLSPMRLIRFDPTTSATSNPTQEATSVSTHSSNMNSTTEDPSPTHGPSTPSPSQSTPSPTHRVKAAFRPESTPEKTSIPSSFTYTPAIVKPTTMAFLSLNIPLVHSPIPTRPSHPIMATWIPSSRSVAEPTATTLLGVDTPPTASRSTRKGTTIAIVILIGLGLVTVVMLIIKRAYQRAKEKRERFAREELERQFIATKESSFFGGKDYGSFTSEKGDINLGSGPSWVDLPLPPVSPPQSQGPKFGLDRVANHDHALLGDRHQAPAVHFTEPKRPLRQNDARESDDEEGVIATAARISAASVYTTKSQKPSAHLGVGVFGPYDAYQGSHPMQFSPSNFSNASFPSYHQDIYRYDGSTGVKVNAPDAPRQSGAPTNTAIGAIASGVRPVAPYYPTSSVSNEHVSSGATTAAVAQRGPLKSGGATRTPSRSYHTSFVADAGPTVKDLILARSQGRDALRQTKEGLEGTTAKDEPSRTSRLSMCTVMMTNYDEEGSILPPTQESPLFSGMLAGVEHWLGETRKTNKRTSTSNHVNDELDLGRSLTSKFAGQHLHHHVPVPPRNLPTPSAPRLTITSPSGAVFNGLGVSNSSSSLEDALPSLAQMALASSQSNYRSPTFSIYNMYDGDDEGSGVPRRSVISQKFK